MTGVLLLLWCAGFHPLSFAIASRTSRRPTTAHEARTAWHIAAFSWLGVSLLVAPALAVVAALGRSSPDPVLVIVMLVTGAAMWLQRPADGPPVGDEAPARDAATLFFGGLGLVCPAVILTNALLAYLGTPWPSLAWVALGALAVQQLAYGMFLGGRWQRDSPRHRRDTAHGRHLRSEARRATRAARARATR